MEERRLTVSWQIFSDLIFLGDLNVWLAGRMVDWSLKRDNNKMILDEWTSGGK